MDKLIDYTKYTTAMAVALLLYIPTNLLPTESRLHHWILGLTTLAAGLSALAGILFYTRTTKVLLENQTADPKGYMTLWGNIHMWLLIVAYVVGAAYFFANKVIAPEPESECSASIPGTGTPPVMLKFKCSSSRTVPTS
ncbi:hypothetical protein [Rhizobium rhizogenes]|uniref:hypothetical protein n=1 Tax=Rhizobium rhizogenes TaxID=359 RepID=UPI00226ECDF3|nr:hypothetical protein [Rhizobium rhizogenes]